MAPHVRARAGRSRADDPRVLSPEHRDHPEDGCPSAALLDEISRCEEPTEVAYTGSVLAIIDDIAARLVPHDRPRRAPRRSASTP
ncbi:hypothetical protein AB0L41_45260 [Amycolatopsis mediterranei]|uniref:hypothetical protein n=1 Tax=Amycolatopsis mediterranei TaxID=33910 RepID=UPI00342E09EB